MGNNDGTLFKLESDRTPLERLLKTLNEYKELFAIVALAVSGAVGIFSYFVTKSQFVELKCFAKNSIIANRELNRTHDIDDSLIDRSRKLDDLVAKGSGSLSPQDRVAMKRLELEIKTLNAQRTDSQAKYAKAQGKLDDSDCMGGEDK